MPPAHCKTDLGSGHSCHFPPSTANSGSPNVFINGLLAMRVGDTYESHGCPSCGIAPPSRKLIEGSTSVFINGLPAGRIGDAIDCGGVALTGSPNVFFGDKEGETCSECQEKARQVSTVTTKG